MQHHVKEFYKQSSKDSEGRFHKVIDLTQATHLTWEKLHEEASILPRGWFELSRLSASDRLEFTRDYWISKLPFHPHLQEFLITFFQTIEDIYIFLVQPKFDDHFEAHLVYALKHNSGFYKGHPPIKDSDRLKLKVSFSDIVFPKDYLAFLEIHDGFCKTTDCTGILKSGLVFPTYEKLQQTIAKLEEEITNTNGTNIDPKSLIPFYESFGMPFYQCFFKDWYAEDEMGNVYYSGNTNTISNIKNKDPVSEAMAFPSFSEWLMFYLETIG